MDRLLREIRSRFLTNCRGQTCAHRENRMGADPKDRPHVCLARLPFRSRLGKEGLIPSFSMFSGFRDGFASPAPTICSGSPPGTIPPWVWDPAWFRFACPISLRRPPALHKTKEAPKNASFMARLKGLEPLTYWFVASHSIQLSYRRISGCSNAKLMLAH